MLPGRHTWTRTRPDGQPTRPYLAIETHRIRAGGCEFRSVAGPASRAWESGTRFGANQELRM